MDQTMPELHISATLRNAWSHVRGSKGALWFITGGIVVVSCIIQLLLNLSLKIEPTTHLGQLYTFLISPVINDIAVAPFLLGALMVAIKRAQNKPISLTTGYQFFKYAPRAMIIMLILGLIAGIFIYLGNLSWSASEPHFLQTWLPILGTLLSLTLYSMLIFSLPLMVEQNLPWTQAIKKSICLTKHQWFKILVLFILGYLLTLAASVTVVIGMVIQHPVALSIGVGLFVLLLIWIIPFLFLMCGSIYQQLTR